MFWGGLAGCSWLTPLASLLEHSAKANSQTASEESPSAGSGGPAFAQAVIVLWMGGGPSQLETFDPKPGRAIAAGTKARDTSVPGVQLAEGLQRVADQMEHIALIRSVVSKEGDHERGAYTLKTGYRPDPTVVHPSLGAILCHALPKRAPWLKVETEIPRHIAILPGAWPPRGGHLGEQYDAFKTYDPAQKVPDVHGWVGEERYQRRLEDLEVVAQAFARRRPLARHTRHMETVRAARQMMTSEQLKAFDIEQEPRALRAAYGDTPFGRACLAARRLTEVGTRCVEVTLGGWDTHANNHQLQRANVDILDPAFATLINDLHQRRTLQRTLVLCLGEFGRTPRMNRLEGRDHWPHGFSVAMAGGGIRGGVVLGETDPEGGKEVADPVQVGQLHATVLAAAGINQEPYLTTPIGRTLEPSKPVKQLLLRG